MIDTKVNKMMQDKYRNFDKLLNDTMKKIQHAFHSMQLFDSCNSAIH